MLSYPGLRPGDQLVLRTQFQVDPTTLGAQDLGVELDDKAQRITSFPQKVTVLP